MSDYSRGETEPAGPMDGNPHYGTAEYAAELVASNQNPLHDGIVAQAYAALALAYEQRTANLLTLIQIGEDEAEGLNAVGMNDASWKSAFTQIPARLGLDK